MLRILRGEDITYESIKQEIDLLGNVEQVWIPFQRKHREVAIFLAAKAGVLIAYDIALYNPEPGKPDVYYDFTGSSWYRRCEKTQATGFIL